MSKRQIHIENQINVGLGTIAVAQPPTILTSIGIGSCVALCIYHEESQTAALAHIMIPHTDNRRPDPKKPAKFADTAVENILKQLARKGIKDTSTLKAKLVGGAQLFHYQQVPNIGAKNVRATREALRKKNIRVIASLTGGNFGRSVWFDPESGKVTVRSKLMETKEI